MHVCMYACMMCACVYVRMYACSMYMCMHVCMYVCMHDVCMCVCTYVCCMYVCMYVYKVGRKVPTDIMPMSQWIHESHMYVCMYVCSMYVCMYVRMYVCRFRLLRNISTFKYYIQVNIMPHILSYIHTYILQHT